MPNGRPSDHPLTDILTWGMAVSNPTIDGLVREIANHPGYDAVSDQVASILWHNWPHWENVVTDYDLVQRELRTIRASLVGPE